MASHGGVPVRSVTTFRVILLVVLAWILPVGVVLGPASADPVRPGSGIPGAAHPTQPPVRGACQQVTPVPAPYWTTGHARRCVPGQLVRRVDTNGVPLIAFTFDDGPDPTYTVAVAAELERRGLTATFFVVGQMLSAYRDVGRQLVADGFIIGNHTVTHRYSGQVMASEITTMNEMIRSILGVRTPFFRAPGLTSSALVDATLVVTGQCNVWTDVDLRDWVSPRRSSAELCSAFSSSLHAGEIVLLHVGPGHSSTAGALACMLDVATARGYRVVGLDELFVAGAPTARIGAGRCDTE